MAYPRLSRYTWRIILLSLGLALLTGAAILLAPEPGDVVVIAETPVGGNVALDSPISVTFSRAVDQRSAERSFILYPTIRGQFRWQGQTLSFYPAEPLRSQTIYRILIQPGLRDTRGHLNQYQTTWPFRTR